MLTWCTTLPLHNFSIFLTREIQTSFKHTVAFFILFGRDVEMLALFVACLCHDIDHRGTTNSFQVSSVGESTGSVLLCAILFKLKICLFAFCYVLFFRLFTAQLRSLFLFLGINTRSAL